MLVWSVPGEWTAGDVFAQLCCRCDRQPGVSVALHPDRGRFGYNGDRLGRKVDVARVVYLDLG